jgi:hypothetical protein
MKKPTDINERTAAILEAAATQAHALPDKLDALDGADDAQRIAAEATYDENRGRLWQRIAQAPDVYKRGDVLTRVSNAGVMRMVTTPRAMRALLADIVKPYVIPKDGTDAIQVEPPKAWAEHAIEAVPVQTELRQLRAIYDGPVLAYMGGKLSMVSAPGWSELENGEGIYIRPHGVNVAHGPIAEATRDDARRAVAQLLDPVRDFPFVSQADKGAWIALILTMIARDVYRGPHPMWIIQANARGAGKSLLAELAFRIAIGQTPEPKALAGDEETRKQLLAAALGGVSVMWWDNIKERIGGGALEAQITAGGIGGRKLGESTELTIPWRPVHVCTSNGASTTEDIAQRAVNVRLRTNGERRRDMHFPDVKAYITAHRGELFTAACTILAAWIQAASRGESVTAKPWGSFTGWADCVARACAYAGLSDVKETQAELYTEHDDARVEAARTLFAWGRSKGKWPALTLRDAIRAHPTGPIAACLMPIVGNERPMAWSTHQVHAALDQIAIYTESSIVEHVDGGRLFMVHRQGKARTRFFWLELRQSADAADDESPF